MKTIEFCPKCHGTGVISVGEGTIPCNRCVGDGQLEIGLIDSTALEADVAKCLRRLKKIMDKLDLAD
jgi:DnaJ-class molecular chaperone